MNNNLREQFISKTNSWRSFCCSCLRICSTIDESPVRYFVRNSCTLNMEQRLSQGALLYCQGRTGPAEFMWQGCPVTVSDMERLLSMIRSSPSWCRTIRVEEIRCVFNISDWLKWNFFFQNFIDDKDETLRHGFLQFECR